jgi:hypothetical protein
MESFSILRTNVGLTTNLKIIVDSNYGLFMESIDSATELSASKFKKVRFNKDSYFDEFFSYFYKNLPAEIAFHVRYDDDNDNQFTDFSKQYDDLYQMGARNITDNKNFPEEFEFFAPIYFSKGKFPKYFTIFRVDGPGLIDLTKDNFKSEIINKLKCIKLFDLTRNTVIGEWIDKNFIKNKLFPDTPLEVDFRYDEFTRWHGIDFKTGGYSYKSAFLNDALEYENPIFDLEKFISDGYQRNQVVFPNIINFSFLYDDTPATPASLRKWSLNRYFGFYLKDMELVTAISPYIPIQLESDIYIDENNNIKSLSKSYPFIDKKSESDFTNRSYYVEYLGNFYKVEQYTEVQRSTLTNVTTSNNTTVQMFTTPSIYRYKIVSDISLYGKESLINKNICIIGEYYPPMKIRGGYNFTNSILKYSDNSPFVIEGFDDADVWLIEIDGKMHNIINNNGVLKVNTDYAFEFTVDNYKYYINQSDPSYTTTVSLTVDSNNKPKTFKIYKLNFSEIKDFDTSIVDTEYSKYEYEKSDSITNTDESKMYFPDLRSRSFPGDYDDYVYKGDVINIPTSSEYTSGFETFRIVNNDLSEIWRKNPVYSRWGFENSISANDQPYLLNNSNLFESFNRSVDPFSPIPSRMSRNLDYFYTVNSATSSYTHHTLHVEDHTNGYLNTDFKFELDKYLNIGTYSLGTSSATYSFDYFSYFFGKKTYFDNGNIVKNTKKYSKFNIGDKDIPNITLFRNIKFLIYDIDSIKYENGNLAGINLKTSNKFDDYKFSIILSDNVTNDMDWYIVDEWNTKDKYESGSIVLFDDMLFQTSTQSGPITVISNNQNYPWLNTGWSTYNHTAGITYSLLWNPLNEIGSSYSVNDIIYNSGEYYRYSTTSGIVSLWNPYKIYTTGDTVLYKTEFWTSATSSNNTRPPIFSGKRSNSDSPYWSKSSINYNSICRWELIELFNVNKTYIINDFVVYNRVVYRCYNSSFFGSTDMKTPTNTEHWTRISSIVPDTDIVYQTNNNPVIYLNDKYYIIQSNTSNATLQNGINIYINHKWKNILVNISIDDNTIKNISNVNRDDLYGFSLHQLGMTYSTGLNSPVNVKLTAANVIKCINDLGNKYGFTDYLNYIVINEDGTSKSYNYKDLTGLTHILRCQYPDELQTKINSLVYKEEPSPINLMKSNRFLKGGILDNINKLNYYNNTIPAYNIIKSAEFNTSPMNSTDANNPPTIIRSRNIHGIKNRFYINIYRHSGYYMPIFNEVDLFERPGITSSTPGNYKFDTTLTNFGINKQRIISKVNRKNVILKLKNRTDFRSIYPMLDEFGYTTVDFFIFKSTWDYNYHFECVDNLNTSNSISTENITRTIQSQLTTNGLISQINDQQINNDELI